MTIPVYPDDLPRPLRDGYGRVFPDGRARAQQDAGPPRSVRRFSSAAQRVSLVTTLTRDQGARLLRFWVEDTAGGSLPFLMPDPTAHGWPLLTAAGTPLLTEAGAPILLGAWWLVLFGDQPPQEAATGIRFRYSFTVAVMP
ncbi:hypothetical protein [Oharaeibacter diazotrophicus]|uniref:Uncharacterized protein n=1 Tax=Oharaeibacter diazotrophicus TaxID=1920512 RepID=A0A4R6RIA6_9HYPH|nr:hypothetical protein [Oharaeibacter diazotrophicus]TDP85396.1 hypothetical protein EDD54_2249 [Oharaeibacter diazotrophicus]BBE74366.1 hypothetical protein OHA_1_03997 [Pleomorphomonas sp. SM30]GLS75941.1 hypothetical protein GCM10007904_12760 [Oharaeibacter diazotrophicus]